MNSLFKISEVAQFFGMTPRMLRYYEANGLLTPAKRDAHSGYRYYGADSLDRLSHIADFKHIGLTMEETGKYLNDELSAEDVAAEIDRKIALLERKKAMILQHSKREHAYRVTEDVLPACRCLTRDLSGESLEDFVKRLHEFIGDAIRAGAVLSPGWGNFFEVLTERFTLRKIRSRCCIVLAPGARVAGEVRRKKRHVIRTTHYGRLSDAGRAFEHLESYARENNLEIIGDPLFMILEGAYRDRKSYCVREALYEVRGRRRR